jgi:hypothetical protein
VKGGPREIVLAGLGRVRASLRLVKHIYLSLFLCIISSGCEAESDAVDDVDGASTDASLQDASSFDVQSETSFDASDSGVSVDTMGPDLDATDDAATSINEGWIGGLCAGDEDCGYTDGFCFTDEEGFPAGMCSMACDLYCPDEEGMVTTFCINAGSVDVSAPPGLCTTRCDEAMSDSGCRPEYQCALVPRYNDPSTVVDACIPSAVSVAGPIDPTGCQEQLFELGVNFTQASNPMESPDGHPDLVCDIEDPIMVSAVIHGVSYRYSKVDAEPKAMFVSCPVALALEKMSAVLAENGVSDVIHWGTYNCRVVSGTDKLSQHGLANAIDVRGLVTASGEYYDVLEDWEFSDAPVTEAGTLLKWFADTLYIEWIFNVVLTPNFNAAHADHFHLDLSPGSHSLQ